MQNDRRTRKRKIGDAAEQAVADKLTRDGFKVICRNYAVHNVGELDLVMEKDRDIYVVEVRSRLNSGPYPSSLESVDFKKRRKIIRCTGYMLSHYGLTDRNVVFLIGQVTHNRAGLVQNVEIIPF